MAKPMGRTWRWRAHRYLGLLLAVPIAAAALSGVALLWLPVLDRAPDRPGTGATLAIETYVAAAQAALGPGDRIAGLTLPGDGSPVIVTTGAGGEGGMIRLDPATGRVLDKRADPGQALQRLHGRALVSGDWGRVIVALVGLATIGVVGSGWWSIRSAPGRVSRLHQVLGLVTAVPLSLMAATGAWLAIAAPAPDIEPPLARPAQSVADVIARAHPYALGEPLREVRWPTDRVSDWTVRFGGTAGVTVKVADDSRTARAALAQHRRQSMTLLRRLHLAFGMETLGRTAVILFAMTVVLLAGTGVWLACGDAGSRPPARRS